MLNSHCATFQIEDNVHLASWRSTYSVSLRPVLDRLSPTVLHTGAEGQCKYK